jgi:hypothetical protein
VGVTARVYHGSTGAGEMVLPDAHAASGSVAKRKRRLRVIMAR